MQSASLRRRQFSILLGMVLIFVTAPQLFASKDFSIPPGRASSPNSMTLGPDHNFWFTEISSRQIGRMTPAGVLTQFSIAGAQALSGIAAGPDGNIWFTDEFTGVIGHINVHGGSLTTYTIPNGHPQGITAGADGNLWFVDQQVNPQSPAGGFRVGSITPAGVISEYLTRVNPGPFVPYNYPMAQISKGPDGNLWFTNPQAASTGHNVLGKVTPSGDITIYNMGDTPYDVTAGPDGNLWTLENSHVAKVTTSGAETEYALTTTTWEGITTGPDGKIWFGEGTSLGNVTTAGVVTEFTGIDYSSVYYVQGITKGPDGALWMVGSFTGTVARVATDGSITNTYALNVGSLPLYDTTGPDGAVWATNTILDQVIRITTAGVVTEFPGYPGANLGEITGGSDGNVWFIETGYRRVGSMTPSGVRTDYVVGRGLGHITTGPDGNVWFPESIDNMIAQLTPAGVLNEYPIPTANAGPTYICKGPDNKVWFVEAGVQKIAKIDPGTGVITEYPFPGNNYLEGITAGPDGNLWLMEGSPYGTIAKISTAGVLLAEYPAQFETSMRPRAGSDGAIWFPQFYPNSVGRITTAGVVSTVPLSATNAQGNDVTVGSDGKLWIVELLAGSVARMSAIGGTGDTFHATHGSPFNGAVASFVDGTTTAKATDFTATINWGDGNMTTGTVSGATGGPFTVKGTHTYPFAWNFKVTVSLHDTVDTATYTSSPGTAEVN